MTPTVIDRRVPWPVTLIVAGTLVTSAIRGLGNAKYGPVPALAALDAVKFLDPALLLGLGALAVLEWTRGGGRVPRWKARWGLCAAIVLAIGFVSALYWAVPVYDAVQSILFVLRPAVLLLILTAFTWGRARRPWAYFAVLAFASANFVIVMAEWVAARAAGSDYSPDAISGLFHDAHQQATFSYTIALLSLACAGAALTWRGRIAWGAFVAANALAGFVSQAQKSTGIEIAVLAIALAVLILRSRTRLLRVVRLVPAAALTLVLVLTLVSGTTIWTSAAEAVTGNLMNRLDYGGYRGLAFLDDLGAVRMARDFWTLSAREPVIALIGAGPANYGSPAALRRVEQGTASAAIRELFWWEATKEADLVDTGELRLLGLSAKTSLPGVVLGEFGCLALLVFTPLLLGPFFIAPRPADAAAGRLSLFWVKTAYLGVVAQSLLNTLGAWDNDVVITLLFAGFAGALATRAAAEAA